MGVEPTSAIVGVYCGLLPNVSAARRLSRSAFGGQANPGLCTNPRRSGRLRDRPYKLDAVAPANTVGLGFSLLAGQRVLVTQTLGLCHAAGLTSSIVFLLHNLTNHTYGSLISLDETGARKLCWLTTDICGTVSGMTLVTVSLSVSMTSLGVLRICS